MGHQRTHRQRAGLGFTLALAASLILIAPGAVHAQRAMQGPNRPRYDFSPQFDFIHAARGAIKREYFVGEPVVVPIVLSNHSRFPITLTTNFNPRAMLKVMIRPPGEAEHQYYGPYMPGIYPPNEYSLNPMEEISYNVVIWSEYDQPAKMAFPRPGTYFVQMSLKIYIPEGEFTYEAPIDNFNVEVVATPPELVPLVDKLRRGEVLRYLHLRKKPPEWTVEEMTEIVKKDQSVLHPYLCYALASHWYYEYQKDPKNKQIQFQVQNYLVPAADSSSAYKLEANMDLLSFYDQLGVAVPAEDRARKIVTSVIPVDRIGKIGDDKTIRKYLMNTAEPDRNKYWSVLP